MEETLVKKGGKAAGVDAEGSDCRGNALGAALVGTKGGLPEAEPELSDTPMALRKRSPHLPGKPTRQAT